MDAIISASLSDYLLASAGGPTPIVPPGWSEGATGKRILIAWKNCREAIAGVRSGLPFLKEAKLVFIIANAGDRFAESPGSDLVAYLSRHGIQAVICGASDEGGVEIMNAAIKHECDLIVMGASGHSRLRELIIEGSTN